LFSIGREQLFTILKIGLGANKASASKAIAFNTLELKLSTGGLNKIPAAPSPGIDKCLSVDFSRHYKIEQPRYCDVAANQNVWSYFS